MEDGELLARQGELQREADGLVRDLGLDQLLAELGEPVRVGSSALGLMVWRDLDLTVVCPNLSAPDVTALGMALAGHPRVRQLTFRDDTGEWNVDPAYPDGLYLGLRYRAPAADEWQVDLWFVDEPDRQPDLDHLRTLPPRLTAETRLAILQVKEVARSRAGYSSVEVYTAVLDHGIRTPAEFESWQSR